MLFATQVVLLYLSIAFRDGSGSGLWQNLYEDLIEPPLYQLPYVDSLVYNEKSAIPRYKEKSIQAKAPYYTNVQPEEKRNYENAPVTPYYDDNSNDKRITGNPNTPIVPLKDSNINPFNLMYRHRAQQQRSMIAGLDNMRPFDERSCTNSVLSANSSISSPVECARTCRKGDRKICYYNFIVENYQVNGFACNLCTPDATNAFCSNCQCVPADGVERSAQVVNRQMPGPSIEVCEGDHVVIDVTNRMHGSGLTIHWHGLYQKGFQFYDGVPYITQCPIGDGNTFRYQWGANNAGTHFWHAHSGLQKMDGVFGGIVVRQPPEVDPHSRLYDYDLSNTVLIISDWMHNEAVHDFPGRRFTDIGQLPDAILINGKGQYTDRRTGITTNSTLEVIYVEPGKRYRIRMINAFCTVCPGMLTIQDHKMTVIASDSRDVKPVTVDSITSFAGERYDFILHTNKTAGSYWVQVRGMGGCSRNGIQQLAILRYKNGLTSPLTQPPTYNGGLSEGKTLNALNATCETPLDDTICVSNLDSIEQIDERILLPEPDLKFYLPVGFYEYSFQEVFQPNHYNRFMIAAGRSPIDAIIDGISFEFPHSPPLSQPLDVPNSIYCNRSSLPEDCSEGVCMCTHKLNIPLNAVVEVVLVDELQATNLSHPFHLHGHGFYVLGMGRAKDKNVTSINWKIVREMDKKNEVNRCFNKPVKKDTVIIPYNGYVVLRFLADNPGYWLFHCHFIYHQMVGMEILLKVGDNKDVPPVPRNFPKCGQYSTTIGYNAYPPFTKIPHRTKKRE